MSNDVKSVLIDFGHGGEDAGAINRKHGLKESLVVLSLRDRIKKRLSCLDEALKFTRNDDTFLSLGQRVRLANAMAVDLFVSIHCNAYNQKATGIETFSYKYSKRSEKAAKIFLENLMERFPEHNDRGAKKANYYVLRKTNMTAVLVELEFIDTELGYLTLSDEHKLDLYADAISKSILETLGITTYSQPSNFNRAIGDMVALISNPSH